MTLDHIKGKTFHKRHGSIQNAFKYGYDYFLTDFSDHKSWPGLVSHNRFNIASLWDVDHGGKRSSGTGLKWVYDVLRDNGFEHLMDHRIVLVAQARILGHVFNPVCFWMVLDAQDQIVLVIAEVNNTFGERHSYFCHHDDLSAIKKNDIVYARKIFHVSPFQDVAGDYAFKFDLTSDQFGVWIQYTAGSNGVYATFTGKRKRASNLSVLGALFARPLGSLRVVALIYYQALKLKMKGANYRALPSPPSNEVSR